MYCAYISGRVCDENCAAFQKRTQMRHDEYVWDTCLNEYVQKWSMLQSGDFCNRMGYEIGQARVTHKDGQEVKE